MTDAELVCLAVAQGPDGAAALENLGWGQLRFLRKATGREPITREEALDVSRLGIRWLTLG
ncbi:hypothetical protein [Streptomyces vastus]|uniref:Uncharacterized protein n=1 Tax=Streptomyces vastus TaxID=285451 RepID=A0ABN3RKP8_9ACTN